mmetsp:Transcript_16375/g.42289  ORF Transcript_16375/g.42289 Transcript_16375/m.42289 type:complete len:204 (-) Transcript_16375:79-690(-)
MNLACEPLFEDYRGPAVVMVAWFIVYYALLTLQLSTRTEAHRRCNDSGEVFDRFSMRDNGLVMGDRTFLNALEQSIPFLTGLWSCAVLVNGNLATVLGSIAVFTRIWFPIFWSWGEEGKWNPMVELSTQPWYLMVFSMHGSVALWALWGINVAALHPLIIAFICIGLYLVFFAGAAVLGMALHHATKGAYNKGKVGGQSSESE